MSRLDLGSKIQFRVPDDPIWYDGVIHAIKRGAVNGKEVLLGYIIDTGNDERVDEWQTDQRLDAINERVNERRTGDENAEETQAIVDEVEAEKDLPKSKVINHKVRHPEQYEVTKENIRPAE